jgi:hypothetical protein
MAALYPSIFRQHEHQGLLKSLLLIVGQISKNPVANGHQY